MKELITPISVKTIGMTEIQNIVELMINTYKNISVIITIKCGKLSFTLEIDYIDKLSYFVDLYYKHKESKYRVCSWFYWTKHKMLM